MVIQLSAFLVLILAVSITAWGEMVPTYPSPGSTDWPATAEEGPNLDLSSEKPESATKPTRTTRRGYIQIEISNDDYVDDEEEEPTMKPIAVGSMDRCDYNPCAHMQVPCEELQRANMCLCLGFSGEDVAPDQPRVREVTQVSDSSASVHWCEPLSVVDGYHLVFRPLGAKDNVTTQLIPSRSRVFTLNDLNPDTSYVVCAVASNQAGSSEVGKGDLGAEPGFGPCIVFKTKFNRQLILYIAVAITLLLLLIIICVLLRCFCIRRQKAASHDSSASPSLGIGLQNPTYEHDKANPLPS
ncbi:LRRN4 C-terminal-like protein [Heptranchias perlo]|uniref:LRRN4 C-terminal-like protein n=1 Tax=Heptranchias perlo TaxID=212740 RepID=UPI0035599B72